MYLAARFHIPDVDGMLESIGHSKLMEWVAYVQLEQEEEEKAQKKANGNRSTSLV